MSGERLAGVSNGYRTDCWLCGDEAEVFRFPQQQEFNCPHCGLFAIPRLHSIKDANKPQIATLLQERRQSGRITAYLYTGPDDRPQDAGQYDLVCIPELLSTWPDTVLERIRRGLCNMLTGIDVIPGEHIQFDCGDIHYHHQLFAASEGEARYYLRAMQDFGWLTLGATNTNCRVTITPNGWAVKEEISDEAKRKNPVFVAMWFGRMEIAPDRQQEMLDLFLNTIKPAVEAAGYIAKRADTDEHNDPIMDRVVDDIRRAPFIVAELTKDNSGVYYEAGFARGLGIPVIYTCPAKEKPHFDVSGVNHVRWKDHGDLLVRLENRILGSIGRGPFFEERSPA